MRYVSHSLSSAFI